MRCVAVAQTVPGSHVRQRRPTRRRQLPSITETPLASHEQCDHLLGDPKPGHNKKIQIAFITCLEIF